MMNISVCSVFIIACFAGFWQYRKCPAHSVHRLICACLIAACFVRFLSCGGVETQSEKLISFMHYLPISLAFSILSLLMICWSDAFCIYSVQLQGSTAVKLRNNVDRFQVLSALINVAMYAVLLVIPNSSSTPLVIYFCGILLQILVFVTYRQMRKLPKCTPKLKQLNRVMFYLQIVIACNYAVGFFMPTLSPVSGELAFVATLLYFLNEKGTISLPMPLNPRQLTAAWLTEILQETGTISESTHVKSFTGETLRGGCHFKVSKVSLHYNTDSSNVPKSLVVKLLYWDKPLYEKVALFVKKLFGSLDREVMYLDSYEIESRFYRRYVTEIVGVKIPGIYYNTEDALCNKFGMILQDLSGTHNGQPYGFSLEESKLCIEKLAQFHASHWGKTSYGSDLKMWDIGGYWTGSKREGNKKEINIAWDKVLVNFPEHFSITGYTRDLGKKLYDKLDHIADLFNAMQPATLIHGDYKVSNIFVDKSKKEPEVFAIDWQWYGVGNPALDVMYFLATSIHHDHVDLQDEMLKLYHSTLVSNGITNYPFDTFYRQFQLCWLDFFIYVVVSKWGFMTPENFTKYQNKRKDGLHLRSFVHMRKLVECAEAFLKELDK